MALTDKKRRFVEALRSGLKGAAAARKAGYSAATAAQAASRLMKDKDVVAAMGRKAALNKAKKSARAKGGTADVAALARHHDDPKDFLVDLMNDQMEDMKLRKEAAVALLPYIHPKLGEGGKKEKKQAAAEQVAGRFSAGTPPKLAAVGGKRV